MKNKCIAIIGPAFFGYCDAIALRMSEKGVPTFFINELFSKNKIIRSMIRFRLGKVFSWLKKTHANRIISTLVEQGVTDVLLISVEDLDSSLIRIVKNMGINVHLYMWDGLDRKQNCIHILNEGVNFSTFDPDDAKKYNCRLINLFAENVYFSDIVKYEERFNRIAFAGTLHSARPEFIVDLLTRLKNTKYSFGGLLYYPSKFAFIFKFILNRRVLSIFPLISSRAFSKLQISELFSMSKFVLDIPFPTQKGLTSRTFEALMSGSFLITTISSIEVLPLSLRSIVLIYKGDTFLQDVDKISSANLPELTVDEKYFLSLDRFVDEIFSFMEVLPPLRKL